MIPAILTIGNFDGVHIGHRHLIQTTIDLARSWCGRATVITFAPHPHAFFSPSPNFFIYPQQIKERILASFPIDSTIYLPFDKICRLSPQEFFDNILLPLEPAAIVLGNNFSFGANKSGDIHLLRRLCANHEIAMHSLSMTLFDNQPVSSSRIRAAIHSGDIEDAGRMLGAPYTLYGQVQHGARRGHTLGFPTANIAPTDQVLPKVGVYASQVRIDDDSEWRDAVTAVTQTPTFEDVRTRIETHILGFDGDIYGHELAVRLVAHMRDEVHFASSESLVDQLKQDCQNARLRLQQSIVGEST